ncbi:MULTISPECIES: glycogen/starch/alpha-glucan phosphorylase [Pelosinus]|uniref:Alpha-1,4 glucan phosphorylase n=1 Tax=Pelosinus fermentans B4 TaxID=1149862 RepID=I8RE72_9FIRM|nr:MULTISPECIES: glycogen/starch/alpha-glucan phosphorylase [Pelosinus]EIW15805.1 glycogen/starch/alpha-glucan phosphorylase [Pelosinus fermentans B4]EIW27489.1 glycogen/starch/alpha-glucan phosphorylase [Pelosinus fermentans A11]OAM92553.1 glycogen/starch/alpha-glucan phosphorylase [Pelosinus fermentans DSM 17108]SDQ48692.1 starch phosphorylase [Pelosinus fermentans]
MLMDKDEFKAIFVNNLQTMFGKGIEEASINNKYMALSRVIRDCISKNWMETNKQYSETGVKQVYYFSMEFLLGKALDMHLVNGGVKEIYREALEELGIDLNELEKQEADPGLGNGGLGRLAACFMESMAAVGIPGHGCGIRYTYGLFEQKIVDHNQVELPDNWLQDGYAWEFRKADKAVEVKFGGTINSSQQGERWVFTHENYEAVLAVPYDVPLAGYHNNTVNTLRLWNAESLHDTFDLASFNRGEYLEAMEYRSSVGLISKILYPQDNFYEGRLLRLKQQYFFVSAGLQSIIRRYKKRYSSMKQLPKRVAVHINDTHPAIAVPELMRLLMDQEELSWDDAWKITTETISYTNHTIMPEALETWPVEMFKSLLPRMYMIVHEINERVCRSLWDAYPGDWERIRSMAVIADNMVHMARLAVVGSHSVNGVAQIHTDILKEHIMSNFHKFYPKKFNNKTNGITHRRWLLKANPELAGIITDCIGSGWITDPQKLEEFGRFDTDKIIQEKVRKVKHNNKKILAKYIKEKTGVTIDARSIFDVHIKRIHSYKRQILNVFHIMDLYNRLKENPSLAITPRTFIFAGKAAPGYYIAKQTIKLISVLASLINKDKDIKGKLKVIFLENYSVSLGELLFPAADVSEQISTASKEASGTGNMKFMLNGAVTIGTLDGANVEIHDAVGDDNIFIFGLTSQQVFDYYNHGGYDAWQVYSSDIRIKTVLEQLVNGFLPYQREEFRPLYNSLLADNDEFFVLRDFDAYAKAQVELDKRYKQKNKWIEMSIHNIAQAGIFSSDRTICEYSRDIWHTKPVVITKP